MDFETNDSLDATRRQVRDLLDRVVTDSIANATHASGTMHDWSLHHSIAETGYIADGMSSDQRDGRDPLELHILFEELGLRRAPFYGLANTMIVAGIVEALGSEFHRTQILPRLQSGASIVAFGYTEPDAGSDVAAVTTSARRVTDAPDASWVISGQKMFTSHAHECDYIILLTRSDPAAPKHLGMTMFLMPLDLPGIEIQPVFTMSGERTNITFYSEVAVGDEWRLGAVDGGWEVMKAALAYERGVFGNMNQAAAVLDCFVDWCSTTQKPDGTVVLDDPTVRSRLATIATENEVIRLLSLRTALIASDGGDPSIEGAAVKLYASETYERAANTFQQIAGTAGLLRRGADGVPCQGAVEHAVLDAPSTRIYAGTSEIQRNLLAERHLRLPRDKGRR